MKAELMKQGFIMFAILAIAGTVVSGEKSHTLKYRAGVGLVCPAIDQKFESPNQAFSVWIGKNGSRLKYCIRNKKIGKTTYCDISTTVSALYWTGDSRTIAAITSKSGFPTACLIHLSRKGAWIDDIVRPPSLGNPDMALLDCQPSTSMVHLSYRVTPDKAQVGSTPSYICCFDVDPASGMFRNLFFEQETKER